MRQPEIGCDPEGFLGAVEIGEAAETQRVGIWRLTSSEVPEANWIPNDHYVTESLAESLTQAAPVLM